MCWCLCVLQNVYTANCRLIWMADVTAGIVMADIRPKVVAYVMPLKHVFVADGKPMW